MPNISIVIRTKNEERWIGRCLRLLASQSLTDWEVILVDNQSEDATVAVARRQGVNKVVLLPDYLPGKALNQGIAQAQGKYIVCLSAHCLPKDEWWLERLIAGFENKKIAGVYGRQIPVAFTPPSDKRDLLITFGRDRRVQIKDYFFHNANSALRREVWEKIPFDSTVTNIEDRLWAKAVLAAGHQILYEPEAVVYHHHGIHQGNERTRVQNTVSILTQVESADEVNNLPPILRPEACVCVAILPIQGEIVTAGRHDLLTRFLTDLKRSRYVQQSYIVAPIAVADQVPITNHVSVIPRPAALDTISTALEDVLQYGLHAIEQAGVFPDIVIYANYLFPFRPPGLFDELIIEIQSKGLDTTFPAVPDYHNYWQQNAEGDYEQIGTLRPRSAKDPIYRALHGLGTAVVTPTLRAKHLIGTRVGIVPLQDPLVTLKYGEGNFDELITFILNNQSLPLNAQEKRASLETTWPRYL